MRVLSIALVLVLSLQAYAEPADSRHVARITPAAEPAPSEKIRIELVQPAGPATKAEIEQERQRSKLLRRLDKLGLLENHEVVVHADGSITVNANANDLAQIRALAGVASATPVETSSTDST